MPTTGLRILLLGGDADHNVGDRAIVSALSQCIVSHDPCAEVSIVAGMTFVIGMLFVKETKDVDIYAND